MRVLILLSTYNGGKYLQEQLNSLYAQTVPIDILVRDDGSNDNTCNILDRNRDKIKYYVGDNIGFSASFSDLIKTASDEYDYYFFCDQDDIWLPSKVAVAIEKLGKHIDSTPKLYLSSVQVVDSNLNLLLRHRKKTIRKITLENSLLKSYANGCTMAFTKSLKNIYSKISEPNMICHDWFMLQLAALFGIIYYDNNAYMLYRQHHANAIGSKTSGLRKRIVRAKHTRAKEAQFLLSNYKDSMNRQQVKTVTRIAEIKRIKNRLSVFFSKKYVTGGLMTTLAVKIWALLGIL